MELEQQHTDRINDNETTLHDSTGFSLVEIIFGGTRKQFYPKPNQLFSKSRLYWCVNIRLTERINKIGKIAYTDIGSSQRKENYYRDRGVQI
ncbi:hypothetical protein HZS_2716 [Henneguya salminicola]|nr:hypothetical protein HZS_2716 [Henneguya salminicola]